ncbi:MAG: hypothetical protein L6Q38_11285 [Nitrospira sp.]|nr:hypothetical protein [Nitrospira sp.]
MSIVSAQEGRRQGVAGGNGAWTQPHGRVAEGASAFMVAHVVLAGECRTAHRYGTV